MYYIIYILHIYIGLYAHTFVTPHAQREQGKVIGCDVHYIYIYIMYMDEKNI